MSDHPNAARFRRLMDEAMTGSQEAFDAAIADDVEWWEIGASEPIRGKAALGRRMQEEMGKWEISVDFHDVLANDEHLIALAEATATRDGKTLKYRTAEIHHVDDEGRITHRWSFSDDTQAIIDFFA